MSEDNPRILSLEQVDDLLGEGTYAMVHEGLPDGFDLCTYSYGNAAVDHYFKLKENKYD